MSVYGYLSRSIISLQPSNKKTLRLSSKGLRVIEENKPLFLVINFIESVF